MRYESPPGREQRPRLASEGAAESFDGDRTTIAPTTDLPLLARRTDYALRVVSRRRDGHALTRFYATLNGAESAVRRAHDRGQPAVLQLVRILPTSVALADVAHLLDAEGVDR